MRRRWTTWLAWGLWIASMASAVGEVVLARSNHVPWGTVLKADGFAISFALFFPTAGALIASRRPGNPIGWILLAAGLSQVLEGLTHRWAQHTLVTAPGSLPFGHLAAWLQAGLWLPGLLALPLTLALFPHGRLLSRRWAWIPVAAGLPAALFVVGLATLWSYPAKQLFHDTQISTAPIRIAYAAFPLVLLAVMGAIASIVVRFRRARGEERAQMKWVTYAAALSGVEFLVSNIGSQTQAYTLSPLWDLLAIPLGPIAIVVAILKYRLYDIDRIINRTLVYGALTALLAGVYVGIAVGLGSLAGSNANSLAIAGATLVVAALFRPARRGLQGFIDRRFYRRKYDATRTLEEFAARLRNEVDIQDLESHLLDVVGTTMQPVRVSLWLRQTEAGS